MYFAQMWQRRMILAQWILWRHATRLRVLGNVKVVYKESDFVIQPFRKKKLPFSLDSVGRGEGHKHDHSQDIAIFECLVHGQKS